MRIHSAFICILLSSLIVHGHHKIIVQVSPPRSLSTVSLRMWQERGDFMVLNEPFIYAANFNTPEWYRTTATYWQEGLPSTYEEAYQTVLQYAEKSPVFVKEISFSILKFLLSCPEFAADPDVHFIFLMRNPHDVTVSLYKAMDGVYEDFVNVIGFKATYDTWQLVKQKNPNNILIISAEELSNHPYNVVSHMCKSLDIPFDERILSWKSLGESFDGKDWCDQKRPEFVHMWHKSAIVSVEFVPLARYKKDKQGNPTFVEITDEKDRTTCFAAYEENAVFYKKMMHEMRVAEKESC